MMSRRKRARAVPPAEVVIEQTRPGSFALSLREATLIRYPYAADAPEYEIGLLEQQFAPEWHVRCRGIELSLEYMATFHPRAA